MALTVVKYRKAATGDTSAAHAPAYVIRNREQPQTQQKQLNVQIRPQQIVKTNNPLLRLESNPGIIINRIPATIKPAIRRVPLNLPAIQPALKTAKYTTQTMNNVGSLQTIQWQQHSDGVVEGTNITPDRITSARRHSVHPHERASDSALNTVLSSLPSNTIVRTTNAAALIAPFKNSSVGGDFVASNDERDLNPATSNRFNVLTSQGTTIQMRRPTIVFKTEPVKKTVRNVTVDLIEANPFLHLGVAVNRLSILKNVICPRANVLLLHCYITLKKLRQNEGFILLAEYFEMSEGEIQKVFACTIVRLASYLRFLIRWPVSKTLYERRKNLPFEFRTTLSHIQSLIECVETDMLRPVNSDCSAYKYILGITPSGIICYVSDVFIGQHDDLTVFQASNFKSLIPKTLSLVADPGAGIRRKRRSRVSRNKIPKVEGEQSGDSATDSADESAVEILPKMCLDGSEVTETICKRSLSKYAAARITAELASHRTMNVSGGELTSKRVKDFSIPTTRVVEPVCRRKVGKAVAELREFKLLQSYAINEALLFQYLSESLVVVAALLNLHR